jgi:hypothetical protein
MCGRAEAQRAADVRVPSLAVRTDGFSPEELQEARAKKVFQPLPEIREGLDDTAGLGVVAWGVEAGAADARGSRRATTTIDRRANAQRHDLSHRQDLLVRLRQT